MRGEARPPVANRGPLTFAIMLANIMQGLDTTIANVALPHIRGSLSASLDQISWVLTSYIVAAAIMMPLTGWLAGRFGIKIVFVLSVAGFTLASALCGSATSLTELVLYRGLQGHLRRRAGAAVAGGAAADQPARAARPGDGGVRHRHDIGADLRPGARRLADLRLQLALGVLHQPAGRGDRHPRHADLRPRQPPRPSRAVRPARLRHPEPGDRRLADAARPRRAEGLVRLDRDLGRGGAVRRRVLSVHRPHGDGDRPLVPQPRSVEEPEFHRSAPC